MFRALHPVDPYAGFSPRPAKYFTAWGSEADAFATILNRYQPASIIEVGSWLGGSAIHMAHLSNAEILCVDTWLGAAEFWLDFDDSSRYQALECLNGYPQVYTQFLSNVIWAGCSKQITPLPLTSLAAAQVLAKKAITADLVYIDAGHSFDEVTADLKAWWALATKAVFGDDYTTWGTVRDAVNAFAEAHELTVDRIDRHWILEKP